MGLQSYIAERKRGKDILVTAHVVCGYPSFEENMQELEIMAEAGVDLVELQFPFSEPSADGPLFVHANEESLKAGTTIDQCFKFMAEVSARFPFKVLMMGYYNTAFKMGEERFVERVKKRVAWVIFSPICRWRKRLICTVSPKRRALSRLF